MDSTGNQRGSERVVTTVEPITGPAPGTTALLNGISEAKPHAVLDLGPATDRSLRTYSSFARWLNFADVLGDAWAPQGPGAGTALHLPPLERAYDVVFAWDILDRLFPEDHPHIVDWLIANTSADARLHVIVRGSDDAIAVALRFTLMNVGQIRYEPAGTARLPGTRLLPAEVGKVLMPFRVLHAFTLKNGLREYVAVRQ